MASAYTVLVSKQLPDGKRVTTEIDAGSAAGKIITIRSVSRPSLAADFTGNCAVLREGGAISLFGLDAADG